MDSFRVVLTLLLTLPSPSSAGVCSGIDQQLTPERQGRYASLVASNIPGQHSPSEVRIQRYMHAGNWTAIFAVPHDGERGVFFFRATGSKEVLRDVWGGALGPDSEDDAARWTQTLGPNVPQSLARCFAHAVHTGD